MLRVDVYLIPNGDKTRERRLGSVGIANVSKLAEVSDYIVWDIDSGYPDDPDATVLDHRRADGWSPLVRRALRELEVKRAA